MIGALAAMAAMATMSGFYCSPSHSGKWIDNNRAFLDDVRHVLIKVHAIMANVRAMLCRKTVRGTTAIRRNKQRRRK